MRQSTRKLFSDFSRCSLAALALALAACAPTQTPRQQAPQDPNHNPLAPLQEWEMVTPAAGQRQVLRSLSVGGGLTQQDGLVAYQTLPRPTVTGSEQDVFLFVPQISSPAMVVAGRGETSFDLRFFDFCLVSGAHGRINVPQTGVYMRAPNIQALVNIPDYQTYLVLGELEKAPKCTLTRKK